MKDNKLKKETVAMIDAMIKHADKGPSGFWTDDYEGCGNPLVFPEFNEGLKQGRLVQKEHFYCPWNTAIMYGDRYGNIRTGCYHSCSINDAKYLSDEMLRAILNRFKNGINSGRYDQVDQITPLLTENEQNYILKQKNYETAVKEEREKRETELKRSKANHLLQKYSDNDELRDLLISCYGTNQIVSTSSFGVLFFAPESQADTLGAEHLSYDDYLDAQIKSAGKYRRDFLNCYLNIPSEFKGEIERIDTVHKRICFKRIFVSGMYGDGTCFDGKEDHVWMSSEGFGECSVGDCFVFEAEVYRYVKTGNGRMIDYSLRNPEEVRKIDKYELPTDEELALQRINMIICETCCFSEHCSHIYCMRDPKEIIAIQSDMLKLNKM